MDALSILFGMVFVFRERRARSLARLSIHSLAEKGFRTKPSGHGSPVDVAAIEVHGPWNGGDSRRATTQPLANPSAANAGLVGQKAPGQADRKREQELDGTGKRDQEEIRLNEPHDREMNKVHPVGGVGEVLDRSAAISCQVRARA
jgi:hypothetical protein